MPSFKPKSALAASLAMSSLLASGCQPAMSNQPRETSQMGIGHEYPLRFTHHSFDAHCYNTQKCRVRYAKTLEVDRDEPSPAPPRPDYSKFWGLATHVGIDNFPEPARVEWTSADGTALEADVDIGHIFKDQLVLHRVPKEMLPDTTVKHGDGPSIFLEVNDRTLTVYMRQMVFLKHDGPGTSPFKHELIQAWQKTY